MNRFRIAAPTLLALAPLALAACGGDGGAEWQGTVRDSAGIEIVTSTGEGIWAPGEGWTIEQDLVIGAAEGEPEYQFGQITGIDVDSEGRVYVLDQQAQEVRVFDPSGRFIATMGGPGAGPGELGRGAGPLFVGPGDTVAVPDVTQQRVNRYTASGEPAGSYPLPMSEGIPARWMEAPDQDLLQQAMIMQLPGQENVEPRNLLLRRRPSGEITDTVMELPIGKTVAFSGNQASFTIFEAEPMWAMGPDGRIYFGVNSDYRIEVRSPEGELVRIIARPVERREVSDNDEAEYRRVIEKAWQDAGVPPQAMEQMKQALGFAEFYPAYANFVGGPEGSLWVQGIQTPDEVAAQGGTFNVQDTGSTTWEVFDDEGRLLGTVRMPPRFAPLMFLDDAIYGILRDELDVQYAARMALHMGDAPREGE
jgi:hypothetical protein